MAEIIGLNNETLYTPYPAQGDFVVRSHIANTEKKTISGHYSLKLVTTGTEYYHLANHQWHLRPGEYMLVGAGTPFTAIVKENEPAGGLCIYFSESTLRQASASLTMPSEKLIDHLTEQTDIHFPWEEIKSTPGSPALSEALRQIVSLTDRQIKNQMTSIPDCSIAQLALEVLNGNIAIRQRINRLPQVKTSVRKEIIRRLQLSVDLMKREYSRSVSLPELAFEASLSVFHYSRLFRQAYGCTPCRYLINIRIEEASRKLLATTLPIGEIALRCGFSDHASFCRVFKQLTGKSPAAFRNGTI